MKPRLKLEWLNYFQVLVQRGSFQQAAQDLFITQQALSNYLVRLEKRLGVTFIERQAQSKNNLTPEGEQFFEALQPILSQAQHLQQFAQRLPNAPLKGQLRLAIQPLWMNLEVAQLLQGLQTKHPELNWVITGQANESQILEGLTQHSLDLGLLTLTQPCPGLRAFRLYSSACVMVSASPQNSKAWQKQVFIRYLRSGASQQPQTFWPEKRFPRQISLETDHLLQAIEWCVQGLGCLFLPRAYIAPWLQAGLLFEIATPPAQVELEASLVWNPTHFSSQVEKQLICELGNALQAQQAVALPAFVKPESNPQPQQKTPRSAKKK